MSKTWKLVEVWAMGGRYHLYEPDQTRSEHNPDNGFGTEEEAIISARKINRQRKGLPPDDTYQR